MKRRTPRKRKSVAAGSGGKRAMKVSRTRRRRGKTRQIEFIESLMAASAHALGLSVDPAWRQGISFNLHLLFDHAARVDEFPLADDEEPAPVFHA